MFDAVQQTDPVKGVSAKAGRWPLAILWQIGELDSVVGEYGVDAVRNSFDDLLKERGCDSHICLFDEFNHSELRGWVDGHEQVELAFGGSHLSQIDMEEADQICVGLLSTILVTLNLGQAADAMEFQTTMKRRGVS